MSEPKGTAVNRSSIYIEPASISLTDLAVLLVAIADAFGDATLYLKGDVIAVSLGEES